MYARRAVKGAVFGTRAIVMQTVGLLIGQALFFVILLRDIPQPGALARGALSDAASAVPGVDDALAAELAGQAVSYVDQSLLGGLIGFADKIEIMTYLGLGLSLLVFAIAVAVIGRGATRVRWTGWAVLMAGASLFLWAAFVTWLGRSAGSGAPDQVAATVQRFADARVAPMWPIGIILLVAGGVMVAGGWANLATVVLRRRREA